MSTKGDTYIKYFEKHPAAFDVCYLLYLRANQGISASEAAKELHLAIQTVTNSLRDLEKEELVRSRKKGRERRYFAAESRTFSEAIDESLRVFERKRIEGRQFPLLVFLVELTRTLREIARAERKGARISERVMISTPIGNVEGQVQIRREEQLPETIIISKISDEDSILSLLGKLILIAGQQNESNLTLVLLFKPTMTSFIRYEMQIIAYVKSIFELAAQHGRKIPRHRNQEDKVLPQLHIITELVDEAGMLVPNFAKKMANEIWQHSNILFSH